MRMPVDQAHEFQRLLRYLLNGGIIHLDDVGGAIEFEKTKNNKGEIVDSQTYSSNDEIALDYKAIQGLFAVDCYNIFLRQELFNRFLKSLSLALQKKAIPNTL